MYFLETILIVQINLIVWVRLKTINIQQQSHKQGSTLDTQFSSSKAFSSGTSFEAWSWNNFNAASA
jgi:hypothetical protein